MRRLQAALIVAGFLIAGGATAAPVTWTLNGVTFTDNATASGSFTFDAATNTYSNVNITTTPGMFLPGSTYTQPGGVYGSSSASQVGFLTAAGAGTGNYNLDFKFAAALTGAGGSVTIQTTAANSAEVQCANAGCTSPMANPNTGRGVSSGSVVGAAAVAAAPVPTLSEWALMALTVLLSGAGVAAILAKRAHS